LKKDSIDKSSSLKKDSTFSDCVAQGGAPKPLLFTIRFNAQRIEFGNGKVECFNRNERFEIHPDESLK
jgi:hypothetical protein